MTTQDNVLIFMQFTKEISLVSNGSKIWVYEKTPSTEVDVGIDKYILLKKKKKVSGTGWSLNRTWSLSHLDPQFKYCHSERNSGQFVSLHPQLSVTRFLIFWALNNLESNEFASFLIVSVTCSLKQTDLLKTEMRVFISKCLIYEHIWSYRRKIEVF